ncbi:hypothetical protein QN277_005506 [Acacia crassicarpa]|uniref:HMA domain-containing protein n=1 Tax=Acacia crassicarpa TaxID=499986 RepID=A0AAE1IY66_9FABA|nr:hypothetical protein QN277_005506 [Acacia crassicarpa]KAK4259141.1 hypothetical protein QN277_005506 [Acacia crassicarpa]
MAEKVTIMKLKVDLQCSKCTKKVKKVLCKFPQVRAQVFDDKNNIVTITVVCCSPEKIRDKLCCKGGGAIKSIEIVEPKKPDAGEKPKDKDKPADKPKDKDKPADKPKDKDKPADKPQDKPADKPKDKPADKPKDKPADKPQDKPKDPGPIPVQPAAGMVVTPCYGGYPCGPYYYGYGQPTVVYDGYYGRPVYDSYGDGGRPIYVSRCDQYLNEENPQACSIM